MRTKAELLERLEKYPLLRLSQRQFGCWMIDSRLYPTLNIGGYASSIDDIHKKLDECENNPNWVWKWSNLKK